MGLRVSTAITLGGTVSAADYRKLCDVIAGERLSREWDGERYEAGHRTAGEPLRLYAHDVSWGRFDLLEPLCERLRLPFVRWSGGHPGQFGPERVMFTGAGAPQHLAADEVVIGRERVQALGSLDAILAYFDAADFAVPPLVVADYLAEGAPVPPPPALPEGEWP